MITVCPRYPSHKQEVYELLIAVLHQAMRENPDMFKPAPDDGEWQALNWSEWNP